MTKLLHVHVFRGYFPGGLRSKANGKYFKARRFWGCLVASEKECPNDKYAYYFRPDGTVCHTLTKDAYEAWLEARSSHNYNITYYPENAATTSERDRVLDLTDTRDFMPEDVAQIVKNLAKDEKTVNIMLDAMSEKYNV